MNKVVKIIITILVIFLTIFLFKEIKNYKITKLLTDNYEQKFYINELYKSKEINYRLLDDKDKKLYENIINNILNYNTSFNINMNNYDYDLDSLYFDKIDEIVSDIFMDHPELIYVGIVSMSKQNGSKLVTVSPNYLMSKEEYEKNILEIKTIIEEVKNNTKDLNEYKKVKYVYDYIGKKNKYGNTKDSMAQSAYSAFNSELSPVCAGYAKASQILFNNIGITSLLVYGDAKYALFLGDAHAWNNVSIEGKYYLFDVTMSSNLEGKEFYRGFLIDDKKHSPSNKKATPNLNGKKYKK